MYLRTPKRYQSKRRVFLFNWKWLWLYLIAPVIIIPATLAFNFRDSLSNTIGAWVGSNVRIGVVVPTVTPTIPSADLTQIYADSLRSGKMNNAISALGGLLDNAPNDVAMHAMYVRLILLRGDPTDPLRALRAREAAQKAINANPEQPEGWILMALAVNETGNPNAALPFALRARDFNAQDPVLLAVTALIYNDLERFDQATDAAEQAIEAAKATRPLNTFAVAYAYWVQGVILSTINGEAAQVAFEEAWRAALTDASVPLGFIAQRLYFFYITDNRTDDLLTMFSQASERDRDDDMNAFYVGLMYQRDQNWDKARTAFAQCLDLNPDNVRCLRRMAQVFYNLNNYVPAADYALKAIDLKTQEPEAYLLAGLSLIEQPQRRCAEAIPLLQKGYIMTNESNATDQRKADLSRQFESGLASCRSRPVPPTPMPSLTPLP
jgi:tetratricopeptide (TPR) repeat protein